MTTNRDSAAAGMTTRSNKGNYRAWGGTFPGPCQDRKNSEMIEREVKTAMGGRFGRGSFKIAGAADEKPLQPSSCAGIFLMAVIAIILSLTLVFPLSAEADTLGPQNPTSGTNDRTRRRGRTTRRWARQPGLIRATSWRLTAPLQQYISAPTRYRTTWWHRG